MSGEEVEEQRRNEPSAEIPGAIEEDEKEVMLESEMIETASGSKSEQATLAQRDAAIEELRAELLVERFDIEPFSDFSAK